MITPRRRLPLDLGDYALHLIATIAVAAAAADAARVDSVGAIGCVVAVSAVLLTMRRNLGRRSMVSETAVSGEFTAERVGQLEQRVAELEDGQLRLHDLEERLEFAERLLSRPEPQTMDQPR